MLARDDIDDRDSSQMEKEETEAPEQYSAPTILWEQKFVALATCSFNPCLCTPPPPQCSGG
jgi:hypothetical protein